MDILKFKVRYTVSHLLGVCSEALVVERLCWYLGGLLCLDIPACILEGLKNKAMVGGGLGESST